MCVVRMCVLRVRVRGTGELQKNEVKLSSIRLVFRRGTEEGRRGEWSEHQQLLYTKLVRKSNFNLVPDSITWHVFHIH